jgi:serine/threonine-protein kinase
MCEHTRSGQVIGGAYVLGERLGGGGMGTVYSAVQVCLDRVVAVKVPHLGMTDDPGVRRRFRTEARAGARVLHRNIVRVLDYGESGETPYLVMEHVAGPTLGRYLAEHGPLPAALAAEVVCQLLAALDEAHACGVLHADVKCDNILVETARDGAPLPRLIDFGLARFTDEPRVVLDGEQLVSGTPEYLAPELIRGAVPTIASDLYAVAVVLYELIAGATPFAGGSSAQIMSRHLDQVAVPLSWRCQDRGVTAALDDLLARALAKAPEDRFANAATFRHEIERAICGPLAVEPTLVASLDASYAETPTVPIAIAPAIDVGSVDPGEVRRRALASAVDHDDPDAIVVACLELARAHVDAHDLPRAIEELEAGLALLATHAPTCQSLWRLLLTLAAAYDGSGDRVRARIAARRARAQAVRVGSTLGSERATALLGRIGGELRSGSSRRAASR